MDSNHRPYACEHVRYRAALRPDETTIRIDFLTTERNPTLRSGDELLSPVFQSIIASLGLNFRVRNGIGCGPEDESPDRNFGSMEILNILRLDQRVKPVSNQKGHARVHCPQIQFRRTGYIAKMIQYVRKV